MTKVSAYAMLAGMIVLSALSVLVFRLQITRMGSPSRIDRQVAFRRTGAADTIGGCRDGEFWRCLRLLDIGQHQTASFGSLPLNQLDISSGSDRLPFPIR